MIHLCDINEESYIKEFEHDIADQRDLYHTYHQQVFSKNEDQDENVIWNTLTATHHINLRKPSTKEIDRITLEMVAQVQSTYNLRNRTINGALVKPRGIFIKDNTTKVTHEN